MEKIYAILYKGEEVVGDNFLIGLGKELKENGLFIIYQTTTRPPKKLKVIVENGNGARPSGGA